MIYIVQQIISYNMLKLAFINIFPFFLELKDTLEWIRGGKCYSVLSLNFQNYYTKWNIFIRNGCF